MAQFDIRQAHIFRHPQQNQTDTMKTFPTLLLCLLVLAIMPGISLGQSGGEPANNVSTSLKGLHGITVGNLMKTAELLDDEMYQFKPTDDVRSAGQILAHVANAQFMFCSVAAGQESPSKVNFEESATTKADIIAALKSSMDYCGGVYDAMTDEAGAEMKDLFGMQLAASAILAFNSAHNYEHYGNLVTYMRINGIVPPSSM